MQNIRVILTHGCFQFTKDFRISSSTPQKDQRIYTRAEKGGRGHVSAIVKHTDPYIDDDFAVVWCETDLKSLSRLYRNNMGWEINDPASFTTNRDVQKFISIINAEAQKKEETSSARE